MRERVAKQPSFERLHKRKHFSYKMSQLTQIQMLNKQAFLVWCDLLNYWQIAIYQNGLCCDRGMFANNLDSKSYKNISSFSWVAT